MAMVLLTPEAQSQFSALPKAVRARLTKVFMRMADWPDVSGAKPLRGDLAGHYRVRTGDYRVQFRVKSIQVTNGTSQPDTVLVEKVGHRDGFYDE